MSENNKAAALYTPVGRGAFLKVFKPRQDDPNKKPTYEATLITAEPKNALSPKNKERLIALQKACKDALRAEFGDKAFTADGKIADGYDWPFKDAGEKAQYDGFEPGHVCFSMNSTLKVGVADATRGKDSSGDYPEAEEEDIFSGAFFIAKVEPYAYKPSPGKPRKGVKLTLRSLIKVADGERLDGQVAAGKEFAGVLTDDDFAFEAKGKVAAGAKASGGAGAPASSDDEIDL